MPSFVTSEKTKQQISEPINFELAGRQFSVKTVTSEMVKQITETSGHWTENNEHIVKVFVDGADPEAWAQLQPVDAREIGRLAKWLIAQLNEGLSDEEKNGGTPSPTSPEPSPASSPTET